MLPRFDVPAFYKEARRVLKPGGALAAWCYYFPCIKDHAAADAVLQSFRSRILGPHTTTVQRSCENRYRGLEPGREEVGVVERDTLPFERESTVWHLVRAAS